MRLSEIRIRNFRTIGSEQRLSLPSGLSIVGPNNSGKTNILKAIQTLFTGFDNRQRYDRQIDLTFNVGRSRTSITATFKSDDDAIDSQFFQRLDELHSLQNTQRQGSLEVPLTLYFTESNTPVYSFFPNVRRPRDNRRNAQYSRISRQLITDLIESFTVHYVPSAKSVSSLYDELVVPFLKKLTAEAIRPHVSGVEDTLDEVANQLTIHLQDAGLSNLTASFTYPEGSLQKLLTSFDFLLSDPDKTSIFRKGMGIQSTALLSSFLWITNKERDEGRSVIWLLEEPESYLHPTLSSAYKSILNKLSLDSLVLTTTHQLGFVSQDPRLVVGTRLEDNRTKLEKYQTYLEATSSLRVALGIRFSDFYNLDTYNIFVEGPTDREIIEWVLEKTREDPFHDNYELLRKAHILDFGGVKHLSGFLRATFEHINKERACVAVFDGDDAGSKERQTLQRYFGNKQIRFEANTDFISVRDRFAIEALFPDQWIIQCHSEHSSWFDSFSVDSSRVLEPFRIGHSHKRQVIKWLQQRSDGYAISEWSDRWGAFLSAVENALGRKQAEVAENSI